jgi:hypothetical protein
MSSRVEMSGPAVGQVNGRGIPNSSYLDAAEPQVRRSLYSHTQSESIGDYVAWSTKWY